MPHFYFKDLNEKSKLIKSSGSNPGDSASLGEIKNSSEHGFVMKESNVLKSGDTVGSKVESQKNPG